LTQAFVWNVGTCRSDVKGEFQVEATRKRVPMLNTGADFPVVAAKAGNAARAKGESYPAIFKEQPLIGRSL